MSQEYKPIDGSIEYNEGRDRLDKRDEALKSCFAGDYFPNNNPEYTGVLSGEIINDTNDFTTGNWSRNNSALVPGQEGFDIGSYSTRLSGAENMNAYIVQNVTIPSDDYILISCCIKQGNINFAELLLKPGSDDPIGVQIDLTDGSMSSSSLIDAVDPDASGAVFKGNGWWLVWMVVAKPTTIVGVEFRIYAIKSGNAVNAVANGEYIYIQEASMRGSDILGLYETLSENLLAIGMLCYRTDLDKLYQLQSIAPDNWVLIADGLKTALTTEDAHIAFMLSQLASSTPPATPVNGQIWVDTSAGDPWQVRVWRTDLDPDQWVLFNTLADTLGPPGIQGETGGQGPTGVKGPQGEPGEPGLYGPRLQHQWVGSSLQLQDGEQTWGELVDLIGDTGPQG